MNNKNYYNKIIINKHFSYYTNNKNKNLIYLDNATTTLKLKKVIFQQFNYQILNFTLDSKLVIKDNKINKNFYNQIEIVRQKTADILKANFKKEIIFVKNSTEGINLIAKSLLKYYFNTNDNIILSKMEHHSNLLPWINNENSKKIKINFVKFNNNYELNIKHLLSLINKKTKLISLTHISNVLGTINPIKKIINLVKKINSKILFFIDGSQSIGKIKINLKKINCDFFVFSTHKIYGPDGLGILFIKNQNLNLIKPLNIGGGSIENIFLKKKIFYKLNDYPWCLEGGTLNISSIYSFYECLKYIENINFKFIQNYFSKIINYFIKKSKKIKNFIILGNYNHIKKTGIISFIIKNINSSELNLLLKEYNIIIRSGHLCAIPLLKELNLTEVVRISLGIYNSISEITFFFKKLNLILKKYFFYL